MIIVDNISKSYGAQELFRNAGFRLNAGERAGLVAGGAVPVSLGPFRLRAETAAICLAYRLMACPRAHTGTVVEIGGRVS